MGKKAAQAAAQAAEARVMAALNACPGPSRARDLSAQTGLSMRSVGATLIRLATLGRVTRHIEIVKTKGRSKVLVFLYAPFLTACPDPDIFRQTLRGIQAAQE